LNFFIVILFVGPSSYKKYRKTQIPIDEAERKEAILFKYFIYFEFLFPKRIESSEMMYLKILNNIK